MKCHRRTRRNQVQSAKDNASVDTWQLEAFDSDLSANVWENMQKVPKIWFQR